MEIIRFCDQNPNLPKAQIAKLVRKILNRNTVNAQTVINALRNRDAILNMANCTDPNRVRITQKRQKSVNHLEAEKYQSVIYSINNFNQKDSPT
mgnify:CR=1 FL=1